MTDICGDNHSSTSARVDMSVDNNGSWSDAFQFGETDDTTWELTDCTFELHVRRNAFESSPLLSLTTGNGRIVIDDNIQRVIHFDVASADLKAALDPGDYVYDLVMTDANSVRVPLMHGILEVVQGVTYS